VVPTLQLARSGGAAAVTADSRGGGGGGPQLTLEEHSRLIELTELVRQSKSKRLAKRQHAAEQRRAAASLLESQAQPSPKSPSSVTSDTRLQPASGIDYERMLERASPGVSILASVHVD
jgi:hypothetical protein